MIRSIQYYWRIHLAITLAAAVAAGVLTGALLVGDSIRGSLRDLVLDRLGKIDDAILSENFFREQLASNLNGAPAILLQGNASTPNSNARASRIQINGVSPEFGDLFGTELNFSSRDGLPAVIINESLRKELGVSAGDPLLLAFEKPSDAHRESLLGRKDSADIVRTLRCTVRRILPDAGMGRFGIAANQNFPLNAFVSLPDLQEALQQKERANAIFFTSVRPDVKKKLMSAWNVEDVGLRIVDRDDSYSIESREIFLKPNLVGRIRTTAENLNLPILPVFTYLANEIRRAGVPARHIPYSIIAGLNLPVPDGFPQLQLKDGSVAPALARDEILLNSWAAQDLSIQEGQDVEISYYLAGAGSALTTRDAKFRLRGITAMSGLGADRYLAPEYPGIQQAEHIAEWSPPFPVDLNLIRPQDDDYWEQYRATPKAFVSLETAERLWGNRFGNLTSVRLPKRSELIDTFRRQLIFSLQPEQVGFSFLPVKEQGLRAAEGSTDFSGLFLGFSIFLIVSAVLLVALLFRLAVEQRSREIGLLLAIGYSLHRITRRFQLEAMVLAIAGCAAGVFLGLGYAWLLLRALQTLWISAIGAPFVSLHVTALSLAMGFGISFLVIIVSVRKGVRTVASAPVYSLLAGAPASSGEGFGKRFAWIPASALVMAIVFLILAVFRESGSTYFFLMGASLLISGMGFFWLWLRRSERAPLDPSGSGILLRMASRNSIRNPARSLISAALICCASFVIVAVGANRKDPTVEARSRNSGTGGFSLVAESDIPLLQDLNSSEGRFELGFSDDDLAGTEIYPFRVLPGEDASCLNLYKPEKPRLLGVPASFLQHGGFAFRSAVKNSENSWQLLEHAEAEDVIPAIGDYNSVTWILHKKLGEEIVMQDDNGQRVRLRIVGLLEGSIFQSELLISEKQFIKHFPSLAGHAFFLIDAPVDKVSTVGQSLEQSLSSFGMDVSSASERLARFQAVENTYLSTFQLLGGLGLLLGTVGLGIILARNILERRRELGGLQAFGYTRRKIAFLISAEHLFLLLVGILLGSICALAAVSPHLIAQTEAVPWLSLAATMGVVLVLGMVVTVAVTAASLRTEPITALRQD